MLKLSKMNKIVLVIIMLISVLTFSQEKERIFIPSYNVEYANLKFKDGTEYKIIQENVVKNNFEMRGQQYNRFIDPKIDNGKYYLYKVLRVRPVNEYFFSVNILLEYYKNKQGQYIIIKQQVSNGLKLKEND